jgi:hypothetical protein
MDLDKLQATQESLWNAATKSMASLTPEMLRKSWEDSFERATPQHRLTLLYFANEVCQRSRKTHPEFLSERCFASLLPKAFAQLIKQKPDYSDKLNRIINVWEERGVMAADDIDTIRAALSGNVDLGKQKRQKISSSDELSGGPAASPSLMSDPGDALLSLDPVVATLARANSNISMQSDGGTRTGSSPFVQSLSAIEEEHYMMEVIMLAKDLECPKQYEELFRKIDQGESDSIKFELDQENLDRLALKVYKLLKSKLASGGIKSGQNVHEIVNEMKSLPSVSKLEEQEKQAEAQRGNTDMYEVVETVENIHVEIKPGIESVRHRKVELEMQLERDQQILIGLSDILQQIQEQATKSKQSTEEEKSKLELQKLDEKIARCEEITRQLRNEIDRQQQENQRAQEAAAKAQVQAAERKTTRRPRWGEPTPAPVGNLAVQVNSALPNPWQPAQQPGQQHQWPPAIAAYDAQQYHQYHSYPPQQQHQQHWQPYGQPLPPPMLHQQQQPQQQYPPAPNNAHHGDNRRY